MAKQAKNITQKPAKPAEQEFKAPGIEGKKIVTMEDVLRGNTIPEEQAMPPAGDDEK